MYNDFRRKYGISKSKTRLHSIWRNLMSRCYNKNNPRYSTYGGTGVTVCERWHNFENFYNDAPKIEGWVEELRHSWVKDLDKDYKQGFNIENKVYSLETCMWIDSNLNRRKQRHNKAVICLNNGLEFDTLIEASEYANVHYSNITRCCNGKQGYSGIKDGEKLKWKWRD